MEKEHGQKGFCLIQFLGILLLAMGILVSFAGNSLGGTLNEHPPFYNRLPFTAQNAVITNGVIMLGVNGEGHLNIRNAGPPSSGTGTPDVGVRFLPTGAEGTAPGCLCEGWGVGDGGLGISGIASVDLGGVSQNVVLESFNATEDTAVSVVTVAEMFRVTHDFHPSPATPFLYEVIVTIENISAQILTDVRYRRLMDWDIEPTAFEEFVTIESGTAENLEFVTNNGFDSPDPLLPPTLDDETFTLGDRVDDGPRDHGALFQFKFGTLDPGEKLVFRIYYGAASTELEALGALGAVGAEAFSLGQPNVPDGPTLGVPNTFIFGFTGIGGIPIVGELVLDPPFAVNPVGTEHMITATATVDGIPVEGIVVTFEVIAGPNQGVKGSATTDAEGITQFIYPGSGGVGTDDILASFTPVEGITIVSNTVQKEWRALVGDIDADGDRDSRDAELILEVLVGLEPVTAINFLIAGDMNADEMISNLDSVLIVGVVEKEIPPPPDNTRIDLTPGSAGEVLITGQPGAVPAKSTVNLTNVTNTSVPPVSVSADKKGGFSGSIEAAPGDKIVIDVNGSPARIGLSLPAEPPEEKSTHQLEDSR